MSYRDQGSGLGMQPRLMKDNDPHIQVRETGFKIRVRNGVVGMEA